MAPMLLPEEESAHEVEEGEFCSLFGIETDPAELLPKRRTPASLHPLPKPSTINNITLDNNRTFFEINIATPRIGLYSSNTTFINPSSGWTPPQLADMAVRLVKKAVNWTFALVLFIVICIPASICAFFTFWIAVAFLLCLAVYKMTVACWRSIAIWSNNDSSERRNSLPNVPIPHSFVTSASEIYATGSATGGSRSGSRMESQDASFATFFDRSSSNVSVLSEHDPNRDFEGVGGWRLRDTYVEDDDDSDSQAISLTAGESRPIGTPSMRRRSFSAASTGINSPEMANSPLYRGAAGGRKRRVSGSNSPQTYFNIMPSSGSMTALNSRRSSRVLSGERARKETNGSSSDSDNVRPVNGTNHD